MKLTGFHSDSFTLPVRDEAWRFTNMWDALPAELIPATAIITSADIVINGATVTVHSLPTGVSEVKAEITTNSPWQQFAHLGARVHLNVKQSPDRPLKIKVVRAAREDKEATLSHLHISVAAGMKLVIEQELFGVERGFTMSETSLELKADSVVEHAIVVKEGAEALNVAGFSSTLAERANLNQTFVVTGGKLTRLNVATTLNGEGSHAGIASIAKLTGKSHLDLNSQLTHKVANTTASQLAKNLLDDESKAIFTGRVHIAQGAQQVVAEQLNRNLLLSKKAHAIGQPQLEIFADDVKCSHGSTTGQIEEDATFYLLSRGISAERARALLTRAFVDDVVHHAPEDLRAFLGGAL